MSSLFAKVLVATDPRMNPAAGLFWSATSDLGRSLGNVCSGLASLFESSPEPVDVPYQNYATVPTRPPLEYAKMPHRKVPDYTHCIRANIASLREKFNAQQKVVDETRQQIDSHERIDLQQLDREIQEIQNEIIKCQLSEDDLSKQSDAYCSEGMLRNVFVHGLSQVSLAYRIRELREGKAALIAKQDELKALVGKRNAFDFSAKKRLLETQEDELNSIRKRCLCQEAKIDSLSQQMQGFIDRLADTTSRLNIEIDKVNTLSRYEAELNAAVNAYERRLVHKKCEEEFGNSSVGRLHGRVMLRIRELSSLYDKQIRQAEYYAHAIGLLT